MNRIRQIIKTGIMMFITMGMIYVTVSGAGTAGLQTREEDGRIRVYLPPAEGELLEASLQIGNEVLLKLQTDDQAVPRIHTVILFDNSQSVSEPNRETMKTIAAGIIEQGSPGESFTLAVYDREVRVLAEDESDAALLKQQISEITFADQDSYLKEALYEVLQEALQIQGAYRRVFILTDGSEDHTVGYSYEEIRELYCENRCPVYVIGSRFEEQADALEKLFALSRATGGQCILLDEAEDPVHAADRMIQEKPLAEAYADLPPALQDGTVRTVRLVVTTDQETEEFREELQMPFLNMEATETSVDSADDILPSDPGREKVAEQNPLPDGDMPEAGFYEAGAAEEAGSQEEYENDPGADPDVEEVWEEVTDRQAPDDEEAADRNLVTTGISGILQNHFPLILVGAGICAALAVLVIRRHKTDSGAGDPETDDPDSRQLSGTVLLQEDENATVLMQPTGGDVVVLIPDGAYEKKTERTCNPQITIGRKQDCDLCIPDDTSVSSVHCVIFYNRRGKLSVRDNGSSNGTFLNGTRITGEMLLRTGDVLEIGRTRYDVQIRTETDV